MTTPNVVFKIGVPTLVCSRDEATGRPRIEGTASSTVVDSHGDEITLSAQRKMVASAKGMTIFMNHGYEVPKDVFGSVSKAQLIATRDVDAKTGKPIYDMRIGIDVADSNPLALDTWNLMDKNKVKLGLSIGAMIPEGGAVLSKDSKGLVIDDIDIIEASVVSVPANPRSFIDYAVKALTSRFPEKVDREALLTKMASDVAGEAVTETPDEDDEPTVESVEKKLDDILTEGDEGNDEELEVEKTKVSIWETEDGKTLEIDTGRNKPKADDSQSAQGEGSGTAGGSTGGKGTKSEDLTGLATAALDHSSSIIRSLTAQLAAARAENAELKAERSELVRVSKSTIENASRYIDEIGNLPAGRVTGYAPIKEAAHQLAGVYGEDVLNIIKKAPKPRGSEDAIHS